MSWTHQISSDRWHTFLVDGMVHQACIRFHVSEKGIDPSRHTASVPQKPVVPKAPYSPRTVSISYHTVVPYHRHREHRSPRVQLQLQALGGFVRLQCCAFSISIPASPHTRFREAACLRHDDCEPLFFRVPRTRPNWISM